MSIAPSRAFVRLAAVLVLAHVIACSRKPAPPPPDPEVDAASRTFFAAFTAGNLGLVASFADRVDVIGDLAFIGGTGRGTKQVSRQEILEAYARLFDRLRHQGWAKLMEARRPLLNVAMHDGHHADYAKAGDYVFEVGRPGTDDYHPIYVFVFRKVDGKFQIVMQAADY
ncbi:MAG TPA: hypothetical protein VN700_17115 [Vicinamibacterales bacterium]|nr:hypothetical protein [Vicinamibacterales bacterium]